MPTSINIKLVERSDYEMMIGRVLKRDDLPHGLKKHFFLNLCRLVISPDMDDDETLRRVQRVVEEGASSALLTPAPHQEQLCEADADQSTQPHQDAEEQSPKQKPPISSSLGSTLGTMFGC